MYLKNICQKHPDTPIKYNYKYKYKYNILWVFKYKYKYVFDPSPGVHKQQCLPKPFCSGNTTIEKFALNLSLKLPLNISFYFDIMILWVFIYLWLRFWISVSLHTESLHTDHMLRLAIIASSALFLIRLSGSRSRNMSQLAMFAHYSHF